VSKIQYNELISFTVKMAAVLAEIFLTGGAAVTKQDVSTAADLMATDALLVVVASGCTGKPVGERGRHAEEPPVHVGYCQVLNSQK
jgi:hypothetical protein